MVRLEKISVYDHAAVPPHDPSPNEPKLKPLREMESSVQVRIRCT